MEFDDLYSMTWISIQYATMIFGQNPCKTPQIRFWRQYFLCRLASWTELMFEDIWFDGVWWALSNDIDMNSIYISGFWPNSLQKPKIRLWDSISFGDWVSDAVRHILIVFIWNEKFLIQMRQKIIKIRWYNKHKWTL